MVAWKTTFELSTVILGDESDGSISDFYIQPKPDAYDVLNFD